MISIFSVYTVFGYLTQELISNSIKDYIHPDDYASLRNTLLESNFKLSFPVMSL